MREKDKLLNVEQVCDRLGGVSKSFVYNLCREGTLNHVVTGKVRGWRIYESSLNNYIKNRRRAQAA
jgi:excisionase family DNA binding protein